MHYANADVGNRAIDAALAPVVTLPVFGIVTRDCRCAGLKGVETPLIDRLALESCNV